MAKGMQKISSKRRQVALLTVLAGLALAVQAQASSKRNEAFPDVAIKNFGQMDERFYRGAQPKPGEYKALSTLGIHTVIDLRDDPESYAKREVEALGMRYVNIPMSDKDYPGEEKIEQFWQIVNDSTSGKFYVHCAGGRHRTGVMGAVYRYRINHWDYDRVYKEMKDYDFYTRWGHGAMKDYVHDYWQRLQKESAAVGTK
jgi:protein tyrosine/serine phosphatase